MKRRRSITIRWSRTRSWWRGTVTRFRSIRQARVWRWRRGGSPACSASRLQTSISAARFSAAALAARVSCLGRRFSASWRRGWSASRSSSCCAVIRCMGPSAIARRPARPCASVLTAMGCSPRSIITPGRRQAALTISSNRPRMPRIRSMRAPRLPRRMKPCASIPVRRCSCVRRGRRPDRSCWRARSTKWPMPAAWIRWSFVSRITLTSSRYRASRFRPRRCVNATRTAPSASAGPGASSRRARCGTNPVCWSAGAWAPRPFRR